MDSSASGEMDGGRGKPSTLAPAFTLIELLVTIFTIATCLAILLPVLARQRDRARRITCTCHLKQIALGFKTWELDDTNSLPRNSAARSGTIPSFPLEVCRQFQLMSNELSTPLILTCPADDRSPAKDWGRGFSNSNVSYFVALDANDIYPQMLLSGDRNLTNGTIVRQNVLILTTNNPVGWTEKLHKRNGNVAIADGSVQQLSTSKLRQQVAGTNRLAMP